MAKQQISISFKNNTKESEMFKIINEIEDKAENLSEKPFEEIFKEFYKKERDVEPQKEVLDLLLSIMNEEGDDNEAN